MTTLAWIAIGVYVVGFAVVWILGAREIYRNGVEERFSKRVKHRGNMRYAVSTGFFWAVAWPIIFAAAIVVFPCMVVHEWIMKGDKS